MFLANHPGWSWSDLQDTPDLIIRGMRMLTRKQAALEK